MYFKLSKTQFIEFIVLKRYKSFFLNTVIIEYGHLTELKKTNHYTKVVYPANYTLNYINLIIILFTLILLKLKFILIIILKYS